MEKETVDENKFLEVGDSWVVQIITTQPPKCIFLVQSIYVHFLFNFPTLMCREQRTFINEALLGHFSQLTLKSVHCPSHIKIVSLTHGQKEISFKWSLKKIFFFFLMVRAPYTLSPV